MTYIISNNEGRRGMAWLDEYETLAEAVAAIADELGWESVVLSESFATEDGTGWCAYETQSECDRDEEGAYAPRVICRADSQLAQAQS